MENITHCSDLDPYSLFLCRTGIRLHTQVCLRQCKWTIRSIKTCHKELGVLVLFWQEAQDTCRFYLLTSIIFVLSFIYNRYLESENSSTSNTIVIFLCIMKLNQSTKGTHGEISGWRDMTAPPGQLVTLQPFNALKKGTFVICFIISKLYHIPDHHLALIFTFSFQANITLNHSVSLVYLKHYKNCWHKSTQDYKSISIIQTMFCSYHRQI